MDDLHEHTDVVDRIRDGLAEVRYDGPTPTLSMGQLAPERPHRRSRRSALVAAIGAAALVVIAVGPLGLLRGAGDETTDVGETPTATDRGWTAIVYLDEDIPAEVALGVMDDLARRQGVVDWRYVDKAMAYEEGLLLLADQEAALRILEADPDLLPASVRVHTDARGDAVAIAERAKGLRGVQHVAVEAGRR